MPLEPPFPYVDCSHVSDEKLLKTIELAEHGQWICYHKGAHLNRRTWLEPMATGKKLEWWKPIAMPYFYLFQFKSDVGLFYYLIQCGRGKKADV